MSLKPKLLFLIPTLHGGGAEKVLSDLSLFLIQYFDIYIVVQQKIISLPYGGKLINLHLPPQNNPLKKISNMLLKYQKIKKITLFLQPVAVISFMETFNFINILVGHKSIITEHTHQSCNQSIRSKVYHFMIKLFYPFADKIICVSKGISHDLIQNFQIFPHKICCIYNPVNLNKIKALSREKIPSDLENFFNNPVIINIGRLSSEKNQSLLIKSFHLLKNKHPSLKLCLIGEGPEKKSLEDLSRNLSLENDILFLGHQQNPFKYLACSKLLVLSSIYEGFGIVLIESVACNVPVISMNCPSGPSEILNETASCFLVEDYQPENLSDKIDSFLQNPEKFTDGFNFLKKSIKQYSIDKIGLKYLHEILN